MAPATFPRNDSAQQIQTADTSKIGMMAPAAGESEAAVLMNRMVATGSLDDAAALATFIRSHGVGSMKTYGLQAKLAAAAEDTANPSARKGAMLTLAALCEWVGPAAEPYIVPLLPSVLDRHADKVPEVRAEAEQTLAAMGTILCPYAVKPVVPLLLAAMDAKKNWQVKFGALRLLWTSVKAAPLQVAACLPEIVPAVSGCMGDAKAEVKQLAMKVMTDACSVVGNKDVEPFVPTLISCMARPAETADCIHKLGAITFVQPVEAPTLAVLVPLLMRGLREKATIVRKTAVIIDNMRKLVINPADAAVFLPRLLPGLEKASNETANPEARGVVTAAFEALQEAAGDGQKLQEKATKKPVNEKAVLATLREIIAASGAQLPEAATPALEYVVRLVAQLIYAENFDPEEWAKCVPAYLEPFLGRTEADAVCTAFLDKSDVAVSEEEDDDEEGETLCNCDFSLAYGGKILLHNAKLKLKRGRRYGLCGPNGVGKSTLMKAIASGNLEGFPPRDVLRTIYVAHDIDASMEEVSVLEFVVRDPLLHGITHSQAAKTLSGVGFSDAMQEQPIVSLSGGWKMKLALARAMLMKADIMLLDEPTNHLDVANVAWLEQYLVGLSEVTIITVSHDSGFLDTVCTDIVHYENKKLKRYKGNLSEFVKVKPEAKSYYELSAAQLRFNFPRPGFLDGVKRKDVAILRCTGVSFRYPSASRDQLSDVNVSISLASRVAVLGANGAGKSTLIKLLTGEMEPREGSVWKHPNLRVAYVAQHAFHHVEQHLDWSALEYIRWRYEIGEDREGLDKVDRAVTEEEKAQMARKFLHEGEEKQVEELRGRRKLKKDYEYEVKWVGRHERKNGWLSRDVLVEMGFAKLVNEVDMKEAARQGLLGLNSKPLTSPNIEKHLQDFGIEPEFGTHSFIRGLSGGQKVKVVLAAAMWNNPHVLVMDEPTNYLDRESLGALAQAITEFEGGVLLISHNSEFTQALCPEVWQVAGGVVAVNKPAGSAAARLAGKEGEPAELDAEKLAEQVKEKAKLKEEKAAKSAAKKAAAEAKKILKFQRRV